MQSSAPRSVVVSAGLALLALVGASSCRDATPQAPDVGPAIAERPADEGPADACGRITACCADVRRLTPELANVCQGSEALTRPSEGERSRGCAALWSALSAGASEDPGSWPATCGGSRPSPKPAAPAPKPAAPAAVAPIPVAPTAPAPPVPSAPPTPCQRLAACCRDLVVVLPAFEPTCQSAAKSVRDAVPEQAIATCTTLFEQLGSVSSSMTTNVPASCGGPQHKPVTVNAVLVGNPIAAPQTATATGDCARLVACCAGLREVAPQMAEGCAAMDRIARSSPIACSSVLGAVKMSMAAIAASGKKVPAACK